MRYGNYLYSDDRQFGFKKTMGCRNAVFAVRNVINYFNERGSNVFMASLDASKAFDRVNHFKLYSSLMKRNIPMAFLNVVINWYSKMNVIVRWNNSLSAMMRVRSAEVVFAKVEYCHHIFSMSMLMSSSRISLERMLDVTLVIHVWFV